MANPVRISRLQELIKQRVSEVIQFELADPRIGIVTITKVKLSKDMSRCIVSYSTLGGPAQKSKCAHALESSRGYVQRAVAGIMKTRVVPHLTFAFDNAIEGSIRVTQLLRDALGDRSEAGAADPRSEGAAAAEADDESVAPDSDAGTSDDDVEPDDDQESDEADDDRRR
jgi:ribosome-binding factor A